jgi:hypothetical protein
MTNLKTIIMQNMDFFLTGPAVIVGVTMYVLSISSLSEVQMVSSFSFSLFLCKG